MSGYIDNDDIIHTNPAGTVRVRVVRDTDPMEPDNEGAMPTLRIGESHYGREAEHVYGSEAYGFDGPEAWHRFAHRFGHTREVVEVFARYVRVFHGGTTFHEYNVGVTREYGYLTFDTTAWAAHVGAPTDRLDADADALAVLRVLDERIPVSPDSRAFTAAGLPADTVTAALVRLQGLGLAATATHPVGSGWVRTDSAAENFAEYEAWITGEVYGLVLEHKVALHITRQDLAYPARPWEDTDTEEWAEEESIWGVYGDDKDNALAVAADHFDLDAAAAV